MANLWQAHFSLRILSLANWNCIFFLFFMFFIVLFIFSHFCSLLYYYYSPHALLFFSLLFKVFSPYFCLLSGLALHFFMNPIFCYANLYFWEIWWCDKIMGRESKILREFERKFWILKSFLTTTEWPWCPYWPWRNINIRMSHTKPTCFKPKYTQLTAHISCSQISGAWLT
jgi:hypothetical protein